MVSLIVGDKGKGKTKDLLDKVNAAVAVANGNIVYLDESSKHMYELNNKIRLIDVSPYPLNNSDEFVGFICGIISQDHDLEEMYFDSFLKLANLEDNRENIGDTLTKLNEVSEKFKVRMIISISVDKDELPEEIQDMVVISL